MLRNFVICFVQTIKDNLNPRFSKYLTMTYVFEALQELQVLACNFDAASNHNCFVSMPIFFVLRPQEYVISIPMTGCVFHERCVPDGICGKFSNFEANGSRRPK